jgi:hypothetical protein
MSDRANTFADRIEQGAESLAAYIEGFSETEWNTIVPNEKRSVGTLAHHVASMYQAEVELTLQLAAGDPIKGLSFDDIDEINANHAQEYARVDKKDTLNFLRESSKKTANRVRELSDTELDRAAAVSLNADAPLTTQFFIEDHPLRHSFQHLESIRKSLKK